MAEISRTLVGYFVRVSRCFLVPGLVIQVFQLNWSHFFQIYYFPWDGWCISFVDTGFDLEMCSCLRILIEYLPIFPRRLILLLRLHFNLIMHVLNYQMKSSTWHTFCCNVRRYTDLARSLAGRKATVNVLMTDEMHLKLVQDLSIREHICNKVGMRCHSLMSSAELHLVRTLCAVNLPDTCVSNLMIFWCLFWVASCFDFSIIGDF